MYFIIVKAMFRSAKLTGPFVQMIYSMIAGDMIRFAIISAVFLVSFSQGFTRFLFYWLVPMVNEPVCNGRMSLRCARFVVS